MKHEPAGKRLPASESEKPAKTRQEEKSRTKNDLSACISKALVVSDTQIPVKPETLNRFRNSPADGCTSIMGLAQRSAAFNPAMLAINATEEEVHRQNVDAFNEYVMRLSQSPLLTTKLADTLTINHQHRDFNVLIDDIAGLFQGVAAGDMGTIRQGLVSLAKAAVSRTRTEQHQFLFTQSVLQCYGTDIEVSIYSSFVSMLADVRKGATTAQAAYQINRRKFRFRTELWPETAELVWRQRSLSIRDWISANTTKPDPRFRKRLCIEPDR